jgi:hypothetical protein
LHAFDVEFDRFRNQSARFLKCASRGHAPREVWHVGGPIVGCPLKDDRILFNFLSPAFLSIEFSVPMGRSSPGCPGTVIVPAASFPGLMNCL